MTKSLIIKTCKKHGELKQEDIIKRGKHRSGNPAIRCRLCMKELHANHYKRNKEKVAKKNKEYKQNNREKIREITNNYYAKIKDTDKYKEKHRISHQKDAKKKVETLSDRYMRQLISRGSGIKYSEIPDSLVSFKRSLLLAKKCIKNALKENKRVK